MCLLRLVVILVLCCNECAFASKLVHVSVLFRHGARTPLYFHPYDPHKDYKAFTELGLGQLTDAGKIQSIDLGKYLLQMYPDLLTDLQNIHVKSTEDKRIRETAECALAAMFPTLGEYSTDNVAGVHCGTKVPILVVPKTDNVLRKEISCPTYQTHLIGNAIKVAFKILKNSRNRSMLKTIFKIVGLKPYINSLRSIYDTLEIEDKDYHLPLEEWTKQVYPEPLKDARIMAFTLLTWDDKMKRLKTGPLLKEMVSNMESKINGQNNINVHMYASYDLTIVNLLNTLGVYTRHLVGYAACVMLELWRDDDGQYFVKLFYKESYNAERIELNPLACGSKCYFADFKRKCSKYIPHDWKKECWFGFGKR